MITRTRGDSFPSIEANLKVNGVAFDLTLASSVTFSFIKNNELISIVGSVTDTVNGVVLFDVLETTFDSVGRFSYDIQVIMNDGKKATFDKGIIDVTDDVNKA
jgi:hypothetical protein